MVATERIKLAETEEELKELRMEKEALRKALRLIEGENHSLRESNSSFARSTSSLSDFREQRPPAKVSRSRSSSEIAIKSRPGSLAFESVAPLSPSPASENSSQQNLLDSSLVTSQSQEFSSPQATPKTLQSQVLPPVSSAVITEFEHPSPWADVPTSSPPPPPSVENGSGSLYSTAALALR